MLSGWKERLELRKLGRERDDAWSAYQLDIEAAKKSGAISTTIGALEASQYHEISTIEDQIEWIKTKRLLRSADKHSVPTPPREEGEDWHLSSRLGQWILTPLGAMRLRREIATEVEITQKPWLNWAALFISGGSLAVAIFALNGAGQSSVDSPASESASIMVVETDTPTQPASRD